MGFFDFFKQLNIDQGIEEYKRTAGAVLAAAVAPPATPPTIITFILFFHLS